MPSRKRMWKYHSSVMLNGLTPRVMGWFGSGLNSARQVGFTDQCCLEAAANPVQEFLFARFLGRLHRVVQADQPDALLHQRRQWSAGGRPAGTDGPRRRRYR